MFDNPGLATCWIDALWDGLCVRPDVTDPNAYEVHGNDDPATCD